MITPSSENLDSLTADQLKALLEHPEVRRELRKTFRGFCFVYLSQHMSRPPADFHPEMMNLLGDWTEEMLAFVAFRGSAKTTFGVTALALYAALEGRSTFILLFNETRDVSELTIANIRSELENNALLIADYGDMSTGISKTQSWTKHNLLLANRVRIMGRSRGQKVRGLLHQGKRPDLVIIDDPEERKKVTSRAYRNETETWLRSDVIPAIDEFGARLILLLNLLHRDSLAARIKKDPLIKYREYPLIDAKGNITWRGTYPDMDAVKRQEQKVTMMAKGSRGVWMREYMIKVIDEEDQEVREDWIRRYKQIPDTIENAAVGVDLASSKKETADFTSMVSGVAAFDGAMPKIYVMPNPVNERLSPQETKNRMKLVYDGMGAIAMPIFYIEAVQYQYAAVEGALLSGIPAEAIHPGTDKRARLRSAAIFIENGMVLFPETGCEELLEQLLGFGVEDHDDLVDAFVYMVLGLASGGLEREEVIAI